MSSFEKNKMAIEKLYNSISKWVYEDECFTFFENISKEFLMIMTKSGRKT